MKQNIIKFAHSELVTFRNEDDRIFVAIKPIAEAIGLNAESVVRGIKKHEILGAEHTVQSVQVGENQKREHLILPIEYLNGWLFSIEIGKVKPEARKNLILYQRECYRVLFDFYFGAERRRREQFKEIISLKQELKTIDSTISHLTLRKKEIKPMLDELETEVYTSMRLFELPAVENKVLMLEK